MNALTGVIVYILIWWLVLFTVLPWGSRSGGQSADHSLANSAGGAPETPNLRFKFLVTSLIAGIVWVVVYLLVREGVFDVRAAANAMMKKDQGL